MAKRNSAVPVQIVPRDLGLDFKRMVAEFVEEQVRAAMSQGSDSTFQPFFQTREIAYEIKRRQTVTEQKKFGYAYEDWGCLVCGTKERRHQSLWMCSYCYPRMAQRLLTSIRKRSPDPGIPQPTFMDTVRIARESLLAPPVPHSSPDALPGHNDYFTQEEAAEAAGISRDTLGEWLREGLLDRPKSKISETRWVWAAEEVERLKQFVEQRRTAQRDACAERRRQKQQAKQLAKQLRAPKPIKPRPPKRPQGRPKKSVDVAEILSLQAEGKSWRAIGKIVGCAPDTAHKAAGRNPGSDGRPA